MEAVGQQTRKVLEGNGYQATPVADSSSADLSIVVTEYAFLNTGWDWLCGLSFGLIPAYKNYVSMEMRFSDRRTGLSKSYLIRERMFVHLFLAPLSIAQMAIAQMAIAAARPWGPDPSDYRKALEDFLARDR